MHIILETKSEFDCDFVYLVKLMKINDFTRLSVSAITIRGYVN